jgi:1-deoxy-D-xylulose-5-phosphate reductoisomerase
MSRRGLVILGSTGSIGRSTLDVVDRHPGAFRIVALAARSSAETLLEQYRKYRPRYLCIVDPAQERVLRSQIGHEDIEILCGEAELVRLTTLSEADLVVNAVVGAAGLRASLETIRHQKILALANKESLVTGGPLFAPLLRQGKAQLFPIDSEHSAIWQAMMSGRREEVRKLLLTSSGGPFRTLPADAFGAITVEQALHHPTWKMGPKITIDSATLANKGLEVIEAVTLFGVSADVIEVVIHPQSIVHSMVEFVDSSVVAQMSMPDMRLPITYALFWPHRVESDFGRIDWSRPLTMTFEKPDLQRFPLLATAFDVARTGGTAPAIFNAANEVAVEGFLGGTLRFLEIADIIRRTLDAVSVIGRPELDDILQADRIARQLAHEHMEKIAC